jgi:hypothetical protein
VCGYEPTRAHTDPSFAANLRAERDPPQTVTNGVSVALTTTDERALQRLREERRNG